MLKNKLNADQTLFKKRETLGLFHAKKKKMNTQGKIIIFDMIIIKKKEEKKKKEKGFEKKRVQESCGSKLEVVILSLLLLNTIG